MSNCLAFLNERADFVHEVGLLKRKEGVSIYAPEREEQLLQSLLKRNKGRLPEKSIRAIYREIMSASLALEKDLTIAYFGPVATNTHQAARSKFGASVEYTPQVSIADVFDVVARGQADYGVVPIENSTEERRQPHARCFHRQQSPHLRPDPAQDRESSRREDSEEPDPQGIFLSHPQVFGQSRNWLSATIYRASG